jgi:hypothetical protein
MDWEDIAGAIQASDVSLYHDEDGLSGEWKALFCCIAIDNDDSGSHIP